MNQLSPNIYLNQNKFLKSGNNSGHFTSIKIPNASQKKYNHSNNKLKTKQIRNHYKNIPKYFTEQSQSIAHERCRNNVLDKDDNGVSLVNNNYTETNNSKITKLEFIRNKYKILF